jgi:hypothetical protein
VAVIEFIHLDSVISVLSAQDEIQTYLDRFTEIAVGGVVDGIICYRDCTSGIWLIWTPMVIGGAQQQSAGIGSGGLPMWRWDPGIHPSDGLSWMRLMTDIVEAVIGLRHCGNVVRGVVEFFFPLTIPQDRG